MKKFVSVAGLLTCFFVCLNDLYAQTDDNFFKNKPVKKELLAIEHRQKLDNLEKQGGNLSVEYIEVGNLKRTQKDGKLNFKLPSGQGNFSFTTHHIEYESDYTYSWHGRSENGFDDAIILSREGKVFGSFEGPEGKYEFYTLDGGIQVLLKKDPTIKGRCGVVSGVKDQPKSRPTGQGRVGTCNDLIRVLVLYNARANSVGNASQLAEMGVYNYNIAASQSGLDYANRLELVGVVYNEFNETIRYNDNDEGQKLYFSELRPSVHSLRDTYDADVVVQMIGGGTLPDGSHSFLAGPGEGGVFGFANDVAPVAPGTPEGDNLAYVFISASFIGTRAIFQHEVGHILGGEHQHGADRPDKSPHAAAYGFIENNRLRNTIMWSGLEEDYLHYFSNPNIVYNGVTLGTPNYQDNARRIREYAPVVRNFQPPHEGSVYVEVRRPVPNSAYYEFEAVHSCRPATGFEWEISPDGFNYSGVVSYAETYATNIYNSPSGYYVVRCKVTFNNGAIQYVYTNVPNQYCPGCRQGTVAESKTGDGLTVIYPNPSANQAVLQFTLETSADVNRLLIDAQGTVVQRANYGRLEAGTHEKLVSVEQLPAGVYYINLRVGSRSSRQKLIVTR